MILAITLNQTDLGDDNPNQVVYTSRLALFENESDAMCFAENKGHIALYDLPSGNEIKTASIIVEVEQETND